MNDDEYKLENLPELSKEEKEACDKLGLVPAGWHIAKGYERKIKECDKELMELKQAVKTLFDKVDNFHINASKANREIGGQYTQGAKDWIASLLACFKEDPTIQRIMQERKGK